MNEPNKYQEFLAMISGFAAIVFVVSVQFKGIQYDRYRAMMDKKYKENHSFRPFAGKLGFWLPFPIFNSQLEPHLKKITFQMNSRIILFWLCLILFLVFSN